MSEPDPHDPRHDPIKDAWSDVADHVAALGRTMRDRFGREPTAEEPTEPAARGADPTAALREALEQLIAAGRDLGEKFTGITRDEALKGQARSVGTSINQALEATVNQLTGEMRAFFKGSGHADPSVESHATDATDRPATADATEATDGSGVPADPTGDAPHSGDGPHSGGGG